MKKIAKTECKGSKRKIILFYHVKCGPLPQYSSDGTSRSHIIKRSSEFLVFRRRNISVEFCTYCRRSWPSILIFSIINLRLDIFPVPPRASKKSIFAEVLSPEVKKERTFSYTHIFLYFFLFFSDGCCGG